ncbi:MAG TPA: ABC transporter substrate-binding protein [Alphaproteobacteria bacterium]|nr:ABC transporter substrate-binding protein [Alphaproteobacteria bacterium]
MAYHTGMNAPRHAIAFFLAIFALLCVHPVAAQQRTATIRIAVAYTPKSLSPTMATDAAGARLLQLTHPALLAQSANGQPAPLVAQSCALQTPQLATCQLPEGKTYTDGAPLTAATVATWLTQVQRNGKSPMSGLLNNVGIGTQGGTLLFTLPRPMPDFLNTLAQIPLANPANETAGAGAYTLGTPDTLGNVTLTPLDKTKPALQFLYLPDPTTRLLKLQNGEVDVVQNDLPPELVTFAQQKNFTVQGTPGSSYTYLAYNFRNSDLANPLLRQAMAQSLNREALRKNLLGGQAQPAGSLLPPGGPATWEAPEEPYDPAGVMQTLDETLLPGPDGTRVAFTLTTSTDPTAQRLAQVIQQQWGQVGIKVDIRPTEWAALYDAIKTGRFDMVLLTWTGLQTPDFLYSVFHRTQTPPNGFNRGKVDDETLNQLLEALHTAPTAQQQTAYAIAAQKQIAAVRPYLPLFRRNQVLVTAPGVLGCTIDMPGSYKGLTTCQK